MMRLFSRLLSAAVLTVFCFILPFTVMAEEHPTEAAEALVNADNSGKEPIVFNSEDDVKLNGNYISLDLLGNSVSGEWQDLVCDSVPFRLPEEGVVLLLRCTKLGSPLGTKDLSDAVDEFRLYNIENQDFLMPVGILTAEEDHDISVPGSTFDVFFYDEQYVGDSGYALACEDVIYSFDRMGRFSPYRYPLRSRTVDISELPPMPEPGAVSADLRPEYAALLEDLLEKYDNGELKLTDKDYPKEGKAVVAVFSSYDELTDCSLDEKSEGNLFDGFSEEILAQQMEEADYVMLVHYRKERAGQYGINGGAAWRVYTLITVINPNTMEEYCTITVSVNDPPDSIKTNGLYSGGAEGKYEPEKAIEYIRDLLEESE